VYKLGGVTDRYRHQSVILLLMLYWLSVLQGTVTTNTSLTTDTDKEVEVEAEEPSVK
jgi:hypothetical protein